MYIESNSTNNVDDQGTSNKEENSIADGVYFDDEIENQEEKMHEDSDSEDQFHGKYTF